MTLGLISNLGTLDQVHGINENSVKTCGWSDRKWWKKALSEARTGNLNYESYQLTDYI